MQLTWFGHGSYRIEYENKVIYLDPYAGEQAWYDKPANLVLISKNEYDHWNRALLNRIVVDGTHIFGPASVAREIYGCRAFNAGDDVAFDDGTNIRATQAVYKGEDGLGWLITIGKRTIYYAGDTSPLPFMQNIKADIVIIPVGGTSTMSSRDAIRVVQKITPRIAIPASYGALSGTMDDAELFREAISPTYTTVLLLQPNKEVAI